MSYATLQNMLDRGYEQELIDLTDTTNVPPTTIDETTVCDALDDADAEINSYITAANLTVPLDPVPRVIVLRAIDICRYRLWSRMGRASEAVQNDYAAAVAWLKQLAAGQVQLGDNAAPTEQAAETAPQFAANPRTFTKCSLKGL
ncbi:MAG: gp436 family protein [Rhizomicrobium sp.]